MNRLGNPPFDEEQDTILAQILHLSCEEQYEGIFNSLEEGHLDDIRDFYQLYYQGYLDRNRGRAFCSNNSF